MALHGRHSDGMGIGNVLCVRACTVKDGPNAAGKVKVCRNHLHRGQRGAGAAMPRQRCLDSTGAFGTTTALGTHQRRDQFTR